MLKWTSNEWFDISFYQTYKNLGENIDSKINEKYFICSTKKEDYSIYDETKGHETLYTPIVCINNSSYSLETLLFLSCHKLVTALKKRTFYLSEIEHLRIIKRLTTFVSE